jgi:hypothetical protein
MQRNPKLELRKEVFKRVRFCGTLDKDLQTYYKAYLCGSFTNLHAKELSPDKDLSFDDFVIVFSAVVNANHLLSVSFFNKDADGLETIIGVGFYWQRANVLETSQHIWFPWATPRNIFESYVNFIDSIRRMRHPELEDTYSVIEFAAKKDEKFFNRFVQLGILQRVGEIKSFYSEGDSAICYATTRPKPEISKEEVDNG